MSYQILRTDEFSKHLKQLSKKYPSLNKDYEDFLQSLEQSPLQGISLGRNCYKVRMKISSKRTGKSGGARVPPSSDCSLKELSYLIFTINQKKKIFLIKNYPNY
jgi:mRNA-degrading endonuclease RelE of RelBE toxin-antitoxin system